MLLESYLTKISANRVTFLRLKLFFRCCLSSLLACEVAVRVGLLYQHLIFETKVRFSNDAVAQA